MQSLVTKLNELIDKATRHPTGPSQEEKIVSLAAYTEPSKRETPDYMREIRRMEDKLEELYRRMDAKLKVFTASEPYRNSMEESTVGIATLSEADRRETSDYMAAFSESNKSETPELMEEFHRMERSFTDRLKDLYQRVRRVDNRINSLAHSNHINRPEHADSRQRNRRYKPVCYKCGRVGHIQYNCYYYRPEDPHQKHEERQDYHACCSQEENYQPGPHSSARLLSLDAQYARRIQEYHYKTQSPKPEVQSSRQPIRTCSLTFEGEENSSDHLIDAPPKQSNTNIQKTEAIAARSNQKEMLKVTTERNPQTMRKQEVAYKRNRPESKSTVNQPSNILLLRGSEVNLKSNDLTTEGKIAGQAVQLLVDTGACVSAIDEQFFWKIYGNFPPKMSDGSLSSVQTVSGDTVPVLGKITVPLQLNGREHPCDFHVMQNLAYDAILGRDFLQKNGAQIDLVDNTLSFKAAGHPGKHSSKTTIPVMGTFLPQQIRLKEKKTIATHVDPVLSSKSIGSTCKPIHRSETNKELCFNRSLLVLMLVLLYLLTASHTQDNDNPVIQKLPKFFAHGIPDGIRDARVPCTPVTHLQVDHNESEQSMAPNERKVEKIEALKSGDVLKTLKSDYSSPLTVDQEMQEENGEKDVFYVIVSEQLGSEGPRY